mmetsp:Transcript_13257/g.9352  ORF Transcript_13257/g.9352 Transcript_13257/m.9352 type:complete len:133 (-) Transcript_13257:559-957(-)
MFFSEDLGRIILIDFGSAEDLDKPELRKMQIDNDPRRNTHVNFVGTAAYMAPECVTNKKTGLSADIWSLACILYQFYTGLTPFRGDSDYLIFRRSTESRYKLSEYSNSIIPQEAKDLISLMLKPDAKDRPSI